MDYGDNPNPMAANAPMGSEAQGGMEHEGKEYAPLEVSPEHLGGMRVAVGDVVEFKVSEVAEDGSATLVYNTGDEKGGEGKGASWEDEARQAMSPRNPQKEAM